MSKSSLPYFSDFFVPIPFPAGGYFFQVFQEGGFSRACFSCKKDITVCVLHKIKGQLKIKVCDIFHINKSICRNGNLNSKVQESDLITKIRVFMLNGSIKLWQEASKEEELLEFDF